MLIACDETFRNGVVLLSIELIKYNHVLRPLKQVSTRDIPFRNSAAKAITGKL